MSACTVLTDTPLAIPSISYRASEHASTRSSRVHRLYLFLRHRSMVLYLISAFLFTGMAAVMIFFVHDLIMGWVPCRAIRIAATGHKKSRKALWTSRLRNPYSLPVVNFHRHWPNIVGAIHRAHVGNFYNCNSYRSRSPDCVGSSDLTICYVAVSALLMWCYALL